MAPNQVHAGRRWITVDEIAQLLSLPPHQAFERRSTAASSPAAGLAGPSGLTCERYPQIWDKCMTINPPQIRRP